MLKQYAMLIALFIAYPCSSQIFNPEFDNSVVSLSAPIHDDTEIHELLDFTGDGMKDFLVFVPVL